MPSPPAEQTQAPKPLLRRASSLPPEKTKPRLSPPATSPKAAFTAIPGSPVSAVKKEMVEIEELSPEAIIPDSVAILRDPEVEIPDDEDANNESDLEKRFGGIKLDRMRDDSGSEDSDKVERKNSPLPTRILGVKRKFASTVDDEVIEPARKRTMSPGTLSPRGSDPG